MATQNQGESVTPERVTFGQTSDVTLVTRSREILVSSKVLSKASVVFSAMFQPHFREGLSLAEDGTCRVPLPDDDALAMSQICEVLHYPEEGFKLHFETPHFLHLVATLVDKYQCAEAMHQWSRFTLKYQVQKDKLNGNASDCLHLLHAAYLMNIPCQFSAVTCCMVFLLDKRLVKDKDGLIRWGIEKEIEELLPDDLLASIASHEKRLRYSYIEKMESLIESTLVKPLTGGKVLPSHHDGLLADCDCRLVTCFFYELRQLGLWPISRAQRDYTLGGLYALASQFTFSGMGERVLDCPKCHIDLRRGLEAIGKSVRASFDGLCLDCFKRGKVDKEAHACLRTYRGALAGC